MVKGIGALSAAGFERALRNCIAAGRALGYKVYGGDRN